MSGFREDDASALPSLTNWCSAASEISPFPEFVAAQDLIPRDESRRPRALHTPSQTCGKQNLCRPAERFSSIRRLPRAGFGLAAGSSLAGIPSILSRSCTSARREIYELREHRRDRDEWDRYSNRIRNPDPRESPAPKESLS